MVGRVLAVMNILFLGDVVARSGRQVVKDRLPALKKEYSVDFTIVNGENAAHGKGITLKIYNEFMRAGVDAVTLGNHAFAKHEVIPMFDQCPNLIRPVNMDHEHGNGYVIYQVGTKRLAVINVLGMAFMTGYEEEPVPALERLLDQISADIIIVDLHAETTAEKSILMNHFKSRVAAVIGTHTHVQTADECIRDGCAYITDVGMCGPYDSILGRDTEEVLKRYIAKEQTIYKPSSSKAILCGCVIQIDETTNRAAAITRIQIRPDER